MYPNSPTLLDKFDNRVNPTINKVAKRLRIHCISLMAHLAYPVSILCFLGIDILTKQNFCVAKSISKKLDK